MGVALRVFMDIVDRAAATDTRLLPFGFGV